MRQEETGMAPVGTQWWRCSPLLRAIVRLLPSTVAIRPRRIVARSRPRIGRVASAIYELCNKVPFLSVIRRSPPGVLAGSASEVSAVPRGVRIAHCLAKSNQ